MPIEIGLTNIEYRADDFLMPGPEGPQPGRLLTFRDEQSGIQIKVPLTLQEAGDMAKSLTGGPRVDIATALPANGFKPPGLG